jgi:hypothetical protein
MAPFLLNKRPSGTSLKENNLLLVTISTELSRLESLVCSYLERVVMLRLLYFVPFLPYFFLNSHFTSPLSFFYLLFLHLFLSLRPFSTSISPPPACFYIQFWFILPHIILVTSCFIFTFFVLSFAVFLSLLVCPRPQRHEQRLYGPGICLSLNTHNKVRYCKRFT